jgi:hypothetical protein
MAAAYGELADEQRDELQRHLSGCAGCVQEREQLLKLKALMDLDPVAEPEANLIARSRLRLEAALDALPSLRWIDRLGQRLRNSFAGLLAAPVAASLLLIAGAGAGSIGGYRLAAVRAAHQAQTAQAQPEQSAMAPGAVAAPAEIANISSIIQQPNSHRVEVRYNQMVPERVEGSLDDPAIRRLLMLASDKSSSTGVRNDSVGLLASECKAGHSCKAAGIRDALMTALRYDQNAGVRAKALEGLEPYVAEDMRVRDAVLQALMSDADPAIRTSAINILEPVEADTSVRQVLHSVANTDRNPYIRTVSRQVLENEPEIQ